MVSFCRVVLRERVVDGTEDVEVLSVSVVAVFSGEGESSLNELHPANVTIDPVSSWRNCLLEDCFVIIVMFQLFLIRI